MNEVDKFVAGHRELQKSCNGKKLSKIAIRHTQRLLSDTLGRGTVRKAVECTNLCACRLEHDVTAAESIKSHLLVPFPCGDYMRLHKRLCQPHKEQDEYQSMQVDARDPNNKCYVVKQHLPELYGHRGEHIEVASLTPYEFHEHWYCVKVHYPLVAPSAKAKKCKVGDVHVYGNNESVYHAQSSNRSRALPVVGEDAFRSRNTLCHQVAVRHNTQATMAGIPRHITVCK